MGAKSLEVQKRVAKRLKLYPAEVTTQVVPRERYAEYVFELALIGATLEKLQWRLEICREPKLAKLQSNSKKDKWEAVQFQLKEIQSKVNEYHHYPKWFEVKLGFAFENIPLWHERDLSNSANERFVIPTASILVDEMLETMTRIVSNLLVNEKKIVENLYITKGQIFAEFVLEALIKKGVPRFVAYRDVQRVAFVAKDKEIQYIDAIKNDKAFSSKLTDKEIDSIFSPEKHLGASPIIISNVKRSVQKTIKKFI